MTSSTIFGIPATMARRMLHRLTAVIGLAFGGCSVGPENLVFAPDFCASDERVASAACVACPPGTTNALGDLVTGPDTQCDPVLCGQNERVLSNACVPCAAPLVNAAGDPATGPDTACACPLGTETDGQGGCTPILCTQNQRVESNRCVPCPERSTSLAGSDASGMDTACTCDPGTTAPTSPSAACTPVTCNEDFRVLANMCVPCDVQGGFIRPAGDDASGADTACDRDLCFRPDLPVLCRDFREAYLKAPTPAQAEALGLAVSLNGETLAVGAPSEEDSGRVHIYRRSGDTWTLETTLQAPHRTPGDRFGYAVDVFGDVLVVGAPLEDGLPTGIGADDDLRDSGAAYLFVRTGTAWPSNPAYLKVYSGDEGPSDRFGTSVATDGASVIVGAPGHGGGTTGSRGTVFVFDSRGLPAAGPIVPTGGRDRDFFGTALATAGSAVAVGAPGEDSDATGVNGPRNSTGAPDSGAVYIYGPGPAGWQEQAYLKAPTRQPGAAFGSALDLDGEQLVVGIPHYPALGLVGAGAAALFVRSGGTWRQGAFLSSAAPDAGDAFGSAVAIQSSTVAVGAPFEASLAVDLGGDALDDSAPGAGAVELFRFTGPQLAYLKASNTNGGDNFGAAVALDAGRLAIGAPAEASSSANEPTDNGAPGAGAVYIRRIR